MARNALFCTLPATTVVSLFVLVMLCDPPEVLDTARAVAHDTLRLPAAGCCAKFRVMKPPASGAGAVNSSTCTASSW